VFWEWPDQSGRDLADQPWVQVVALEFPEGKPLAAHRAPAGELFTRIVGAIRITLEGTERELRPGGGVAVREGQVHVVTGRSPGRVILFLRNNGDRT